MIFCTTKKLFWGLKINQNHIDPSNVTISEAEFTANIANPESVYGYGGGLFIDKRRENRGPDGGKHAR